MVHRTLFTNLGAVTVVFTVKNSFGDTQNGLVSHGFHPENEEFGDNIADPFLDMLTHIVLDRFAAQPLEWVYNHNVDAMRDFVFTGDEPRPLAPSEQETMETMITNRYLTGARALLDVLRGTSLPTGSIPANENSVIHANLFGETVVGDPACGVDFFETDPEREPYQAYDLSLHGPSTTYVAPGGMIWDHIAKRFTGFTWFGGFYRAPYLLSTLVEEVGVMWQTSLTQLGHFTRYAILNLSCTAAGNIIDINYDVAVTRYGMGQGENGPFGNLYISKSIQIELCRDDNYVFDTTSYLSGERRLPLYINVSFSGECKYAAMIQPDPEYPFIPIQFEHWADRVSSSRRQTRRFTVLGEGGHTYGLGPFIRYGELSAEPLATHDKVARKVYGFPGRLDAWMKKNMGDIAPLTLHSAVDAVQSHVDFTGQNLLETLAEFKQIKGLISPLKNIRQLVQIGRSGSVTGTVASGLKNVSDAYLLNQFMIEPGIKQIDDFAKNYDRIVNVLQGKGIWGLKTLYGSFTFSPPDDIPGHNGVSVKLTTKMQVVFDDSTLLSLILGGNALGIMPRLGNLWDCMSYSFVIDWFTRESERLNTIDWATFIYMLPIRYCMHSVRAISSWSEGDLQEAPRLTSQRTCLSQFYLRWATNYAPVLHFSRFDPFPLTSPFEVVKDKAKTMACMGYSMIGS
jgi:hypothetical protein